MRSKTSRQLYLALALCGTLLCAGAATAQEGLQAATERFRPAAEAGDLAAQYELGLAFFHEGSLPTRVMGIRWLGRAAREGHAGAQAKLEELRPTEPIVDLVFLDPARVAAAEGGDREEQFRLGYSYWSGTGGVAQDRGRAAALYLRSARQGFPVAQYYLGLAYADGEGMTRDPVKAHIWLGIARAAPDIPPEFETQAEEKQEEVAKSMSPAQIHAARAQATSFRPTPEQPKGDS